PAPARRQMVDGLVIEQHAALTLPDEAGNDAQQRGLAAARRSEQRDELAPRDIEIDVAHGDELAEAMADVLEAQPVPAMRRHDPWWLSFNPGNSPSPDARRASMPAPAIVGAREDLEQGAAVLDPRQHWAASPCVTFQSQSMEGLRTDIVQGCLSDESVCR